MGTVNALVETLNEERSNIDIVRQQQAMTHFKSQADTARERDRPRSNPSSTAASFLGRGAGLTQARNAAQTRLRRGIRGYNQAALNLAAAKVAADRTTGCATSRRSRRQRSAA